MPMVDGERVQSIAGINRNRKAQFALEKKRVLRYDGEKKEEKK